jgi:hypothetical protein
MHFAVDKAIVKDVPIDGQEASPVGFVGEKMNGQRVAVKCSDNHVV